MRISAIEEYGLRCLLALARKGTTSKLSIAEIAELEGLSQPYAAKVLGILRQVGLVVAHRGRTGGFSVSRSADEISLFEVITALGGPLMDPAHCTRFKGQLDRCIHLESCSVHYVLGGLAGFIGEHLAKTSLQDILNTSDLLKAQRRDSLSAITLSANTRANRPDLERTGETGAGNSN